MGCVIPLGVFALSVRSGWQTAAIVGVQLRRQGAVFLSKNFQGFVFAKNVALFDFLPERRKEERRNQPSRLYTICKNGLQVLFNFLCYTI